MEYVDELFKACGLAVISVLCIAVIGGISGNIATVLRVGGGMAVFAISLFLLGENLSELKGIVSSISGIGEGVQRGFYVMIKALGIALVSKFCSDICRDCGENTIASGVESVGRMAMIALCLPLLADILALSREVMEVGI